MFKLTFFFLGKACEVIAAMCSVLCEIPIFFFKISLNALYALLVCKIASFEPEISMQRLF